MRPEPRTDTTTTSGHPRRRSPRLLMVAIVAVAVIGLSSPSGPTSASGNRDLPAPRAERAVALGQGHTCALLDGGTVTCWGRNVEGQLGQGNVEAIGDQPGEVASLPPVDLGTGRTATAIAVGSRHSCALLDNGSVKCWGWGDFGILGYGDTVRRGDGPDEMGDNLPAIDLGTGRTATAITSSALHTCALLDDGSAKCWGSGASGKLGYEDSTSRGDGPDEMGDDLPAIDFGTGRTATALTTGFFHTCALLDNGSVKCWGQSAVGQLGYGDTVTRGNDPGEMGDGLPTVELGTGRTAAALTTGFFHSCVLLDDDSVACWGQGSFGRLGNGAVTNIGDGPSEMGDDLPQVELGTGRTPLSISAGAQHTCVLLADPSIVCWGDGSDGALGHGDVTNIGDGPGEMGNDVPVVDLGTGRTPLWVGAGQEHTCVVLADATVTCWGEGIDGELGNGSVAILGDGPGEMGDSLATVPLDGTIAAAAMTASMDRTPATVIAGSPITHTVTITNTGHQPLSGVAVTLPGGTCTPVAPIALATTSTSTCSLRPTNADAPSITRAATVATTNTVLGNPLSFTTNTLTTNVTRTTQRPDALVRVGKRPFVGDDVYNRTGKKQIAKGTTAKKPVKYTVRVQNDGNEPDTLRVRGSKSTKTFTVTYRAGTKKITKKVTTGTYRVRNLAPGASRLITITVTPKKTTKAGAKTPTRVTVTSTTDTTKTDTVKMTTRRR